jgi:sortase A
MGEGHSDGRRAGRSGVARLVREVGLGLIVAGIVVLLFVAYDLFGTNFAEQSSQARLAQQFSSALSRSASLEAPPVSNGRDRGGRPGTAAAPAKAHHLASAAALLQRVQGKPSSASGLRSGAGRSTREARVALPVPPPGGALDHLVIPAIGVDRYVVEGVAEQDLQMGPGHYPGTPLPGQRGNVGIAGHRTTFGAPFFRLNELRKGDLVYLTDTTGTTWVYSVQRMWVVYPDDVAVLGPTQGAELTLTTCNPRFWATTRLIVRAGLAGRLASGTKLVGATALPPSLAALREAGARDAKVAVASGETVPTLVPVRGLPAGAAAGVTKGAAASGAHAAPANGRVSRHPAGADDPVVGSLELNGAGMGTWAAALGWGALAVALWVLVRVVAARRRRYAKVGVIAAGALACLVPLWFAFGAAVNLLPANF